MPQGLRRAQIALPIIIPIADHDWNNPTFVHKFGANPDVDAAVDVWDGDQDYVYNASAATMYLSSDTSADQGIEVTIVGLNSSWNEVTQVVSTDGTDGQTFVALGTQLIRVYRAYVSGGTAPAGDLYISDDNTDTGPNGIPDDLDNMKALILAGNNQTLMSIYTIPNAFTGYLLDHTSSVLGGGTKSVDMVFQTRASGGVFRVRDKWTSIQTGANPYQKFFPAPISLPAKTDIKVRVVAASTTNMTVTNTFSILLLPDST